MRVPLSWLREYVDVPAEATPEDVLAALVSVGFEEEDVHRFDLQGPIVVGEVLEFTEEPQSNGKTIRWCQVRVAPDGETAADGGPAVHGIVCGALNFFEGDKVVVTLPGAVLPGPFPIAARKTYGHVSDGMIASAKELGLGSEHSGILRLVELGVDAPVGTDAIALLGLDDVAVEINVTPDRGYALSMRGVAREYSHATGAAFRDPADGAPEWSSSGFPLAILDEAPIRGRVGATGFALRAVHDVDASRPTPPWMITRLTLAGIRSISVLVDITNYVMLELGNPIHGVRPRQADRRHHGAPGAAGREARDARRPGARAASGGPADHRRLRARSASPASWAAARPRSARARANVLVEAATFDQVSIARTARRHKLPSEASRRFERGVDPLVAVAAADRVVQLMVAYAGGTASDLGAMIVEPFVAPEIALAAGFVSSLIGVEYTSGEVRGALELIGCRVLDAEDGWVVTPPSWRPDLTDKWTLAEEVARIEGYDRIPSELPTPPSGRGLTSAQQGRRRVSNALAASGFVETPSFPFTTEEQNDLHGSASGEHLPSVKLANPLDGQAPFLRRSLVQGLLADRAPQRRPRTDRPGAVRGGDRVPARARGRLRHRRRAASRRATGCRDARRARRVDPAAAPPRRRARWRATRWRSSPGVAAGAAGLADVLDAARTVALAAGVELNVDAGRSARAAPGAHRGAVGGGRRRRRPSSGTPGELLPAVAEAADLPGRVVVAELDLDLLLTLAGEKVVAASLSGFPAATQDVSLVVPVDVAAGDVRASLVEGAGELLESLRLVDDYRGSGVPEGSKSLTFALRFRAPDRTLTAAEATESKLAGVALAAERFGATLRE